MSKAERVFSRLQEAGLALQRGDAESARVACESLLQANGRDADARHLRGRCMAALGSLDRAVEDFRLALTIRPNHFLTLADLGIALATSGQHEEATVRLSAALALDSRPAELHFALGQCRLARGELPAAVQSFKEAVTRKPAFPDAYNNLGVALDRLGDTSTAMRCFEHALSLDPRSLTALRNLADVLRRAGRVADAAEVLKQAAALQPNDTELLCELAELWCDTGRWHDALVTAQAAIQRTPGSARAHAAAGMALLGADQCSLAADSLERALNLDATLGYAAVNWGEALLRLERPQQAAYAYRNALGASSVRVEAHLGLGRSLALLGDIAGAAQSFRSAYEVRPEDVANALTVASRLEEVGQPEMASAILTDATTRAPGDAGLHYALGALFHRRVRLAEAVGSYDRALRIAPDHVQTILDRGHALESLGRLADAVAAFKLAQAIQPQSAEAVAGLVSCAFRRCDWDQVESGMELLEHFSAGLDILHPFLLLAAGVSPSKQLTLLERRAARITAQWPVADAPPLVRSHSPLKVAYLSPDFREHAVAHAIVRVIESHDRNRVQPIGVCLAAADRSEVSARLRSAFDLTIDVSEASDREIVAQLRELEVDIAVDLAGFTVGARTPIFAARCAPIQVNYLGFPATMGARFMDYIIADEVVIPKDAEASYAEQVVRLPHCYLPLDCTRVAAASPDRAEAGLPAQAIVFCGFNNSYKIARSVFRVWMSLLCEIPGSVLWLRNMGTEAMENLRRAAEQLGVAPSRLVFASHVDRVDEYLARLQLADVFLDTLPYNAHTTAADALWAGVPVVTCRGNTFAGRVGASLLTAAGLSDLVCDNLDDYRSKALRLAIRPDELRDARERLAHARRQPAPVFDMQLYTHGLEDLYLNMRAHPTGRSNHLA